MKILIVDDSELLRDRLRDSLRLIKGVEIVGEAGDGIHGLELMRKHNPDFIILDIRMPELGGIQVLQQMNEEGIKCKKCVFTNYPYLQYKLRCLSEGADYFFDKNNDFMELINLVSTLSIKAN